MPDLSRILADSNAVDYKPEHGFYSELGRTIRHIRKAAGDDGTIKLDQACSLLAARQRDEWFKLSELQWSGLDDWLMAQQASVHVSDIRLAHTPAPIQLACLVRIPETSCGLSNRRMLAS